MSGSRAQALRKNSSPIERKMWRLLFAFRTNGYHFRKQAPIGQYVVDFACHHAKLIIEVDGDTHGTALAMRADARRDDFLRSQGYMVLRFPNGDVVRNSRGVFETVERALRGKPTNHRVGHPLPVPPHKGEGDLTAIPAEGQKHAEGGTSPLVGEAGWGDYDA